VIAFLKQRNGFGLAPDAFAAWPSIGIVLASLVAIALPPALVAYLYMSLTLWPRSPIVTVWIGFILSALLPASIALWTLPWLARTSLRQLLLRAVSVKGWVLGAVGGGLVARALANVSGARRSPKSSCFAG